MSIIPRSYDDAKATDPANRTLGDTDGSVPRECEGCKGLVSRSHLRHVFGEYLCTYCEDARYKEGRTCGLRGEMEQD